MKDCYLIFFENLKLKFCVFQLYIFKVADTEVFILIRYSI